MFCSFVFSFLVGDSSKEVTTTSADIDGASQVTSDWTIGCCTAFDWAWISNTTLLTLFKSYLLTKDVEKTLPSDFMTTQPLDSPGLFVTIFFTRVCYWSIRTMSSWLNNKHNYQQSKLVSVEICTSGCLGLEHSTAPSQQWISTMGWWRNLASMLFTTRSCTL